MTKPTEEQIKALKPGDRVLVEATVSEPLDDHGDICVTLPKALDRYVKATDIHSILPREIKVGDTVRRKDNHNATYEVIGGPRSWGGGFTEVALWTDKSGYSSEDPAALEVIS